jgi:hypothetical protein
MKSSRAWGILATLVVSAAIGADKLYVAKSKDQGAPFDLTLVEVKRDASRSTIQVPKFHSRTAAGSRWLMCMYNDLAAKRGFKYWTVIYPLEPGETFPIAFYQNASENVPKLLGTDFVAERAFPPQPMSVEKWHEKLCWAK